MDIKISFWGAAQNVTGSKYLLEANGKKFVIDYGIYQEHDLKGRNWLPAQVPPTEIDGIFLTHAHLDHCGLLPRLVKEGYRGKIYATAATCELVKIVLADCAKINEEDSRFKQNRHKREGRVVEHPEVPLYTTDEARKVFNQLTPVPHQQPLGLGGGVYAEFQEVGHILGATSIRFTIAEDGQQRTVFFSGDVGRSNMPIIRDPAPIGDADYIICESTYGDRIHGETSDIPAELTRIINETTRDGGNLIIPSFAIERTQDLIYYLATLLKEDRIPHLRIFIDSPMAVKVTDIFRRFPSLFDEETLRLARNIRIPSLTLVRTTADSKSINRIKGTAIIIAGSGMCTGGRIKHHLAANITRKECRIMFVGYQAKETLGRIIIDGAKRVRILGEEYPVNATIERISGFSAHADQQELLTWLKTTSQKPRRLFVTHGEPQAAQALSELIQNQLGWQTYVPEYGETVTLQ